MEKKDKIYGGSSRVIQTKYGPLTTVSQTPKELENLLAYAKDNGLDYVNLNIVKNKDQVPNKPTHHLVVNTYNANANKKKYDMDNGTEWESPF